MRLSSFKFFTELFFIGSGLLLVLACTILKTKKFALINASKPLGKVITIIFLMGACLIVNEISLVCLLNGNFYKVTSIYNVISGDILSLVFKLIVCIFSSIFFYIITDFLKEKKIESEFLLILYFAIIGLELLCVCNDLISSYLAIELISLSSYLLASYKKESNYSIEAGIKYFIMGSISSAFFLLGSSLIYACSGTVNFSEMHHLYHKIEVEHFPSTVNLHSDYCYDFSHMRNLIFMKSPHIKNHFLTHLPANYDGNVPNSARDYLLDCSNPFSKFCEPHPSVSELLKNVNACHTLQFIQRNTDPQSFNKFLTSLIESKAVYEKQLLDATKEKWKVVDRIVLITQEIEEFKVIKSNWIRKFLNEMQAYENLLNNFDSILDREYDRFRLGRSSKECIVLGERLKEMQYAQFDKAREVLAAEGEKIDLMWNSIDKNLKFEVELFWEKQKYVNFIKETPINHPIYDNLSLLKKVEESIKKQIKDIKECHDITHKLYKTCIAAREQEDLLVQKKKIKSTFFLNNNSFKLIELGLIFILFSIFIKLALAPFHLWSLDVYEGSPTISTFFFSVMTKLSLFMFLIKFCYAAMAAFITEWQFYSLWVASFSLFVGSFGGLKQRKLKTLLAYSSINHMGYSLLAFSTGSFYGLKLLIIYLIVYMLSGTCIWFSFLLLKLKKRKNKFSKELGDLSLLGKSHPALSFSLAITFFSVAGLPPFIGFLAKIGVFLVLLKEKFYFFCIIAILCSVVSTFYYIRIIKTMFFENILVGKLYYPIKSNKVWLLSFLTFLLLFLFVNPKLFFLIIHIAIES